MGSTHLVWSTLGFVCFQEIRVGSPVGTVQLLSGMISEITRILSASGTGGQGERSNRKTGSAGPDLDHARLDPNPDPSMRRTLPLPREVIFQAAL